jgi:hypothetical protein
MKVENWYNAFCIKFHEEVTYMRVVGELIQTKRAQFHSCAGMYGEDHYDMSHVDVFLTPL